MILNQFKKNVLYLKRRALLCLLFYGSMLAQNPPYVGKEFKFDKVIAYKLKEGSCGWVVMNQKLNSKIIKHEYQLFPQQIDTLHIFLRKTTKSKSKMDSECWNCYIGIVYYFNEKIVANFSISKNCNLFLFYSRRDANDPWSVSALKFTEDERKKVDKIFSRLFK